MRKVLLRWKVSSLSGIDEIDKLMEICYRIEVLGHLLPIRKELPNW